MSTCDLFFSLRSDALAALLGLAVAGAAPSPFLEGGASLASLPAWSLDSFEGRPFLRFCSGRGEPTQGHHNRALHTASSKACNRASLLFRRSSRCDCSRRVRTTSQKLPGLDILPRAAKVQQHQCALPSLLCSPGSYTVEGWNKGMLSHRLPHLPLRTFGAVLRHGSCTPRRQTKSCVLLSTLSHGLAMVQTTPTKWARTSAQCAAQGCPFPK